MSVVAKVEERMKKIDRLMSARLEYDISVPEIFPGVYSSFRDYLERTDRSYLVKDADPVIMKEFGIIC